MLTPDEILTRGGITIDQMAQLIVDKEAIAIFLRDIQQGIIIKRGLTEGNEAKLMGAIECIDDIIDRIGRLEEARNEYFAAKQKADEAKAKSE